jgi:MerR family copper efflux transcriptional regulator
MFIQELARLTGVSTKAIRYYESIGLLPAPRRAANHYREYARATADRLRVIASARRLGFGLADIAALLATRDNGGSPCGRVMNLLDQRLTEIDQRVADLLATRDALDQIRRQGLALPRDHTCDGECVDYFTTPQGGQPR